MAEIGSPEDMVSDAGSPVVVETGPLEDILDMALSDVEDEPMAS